MLFSLKNKYSLTRGVPLLVVLFILIGRLTYSYNDYRNPTSSKATYQADMSTPTKTWRSFTTALTNKDEATLQMVTTPESLAFLKNHAQRSPGGLPNMWKWGSAWSGDRLKWKRYDLYEAEALMGNEKDGAWFKFQKTPQGWRLSEWNPEG